MADDGKIPAMQTAAKNLVDQLSGLARTPGDIYISIIPFAKDVNGGASNYNQSWVDFTDWDAGPGNRQLWHMQPARSDLRCNIAPAARRTSSSLPRRARPPRCLVRSEHRCRNCASRNKDANSNQKARPRGRAFSFSGAEF
jgi:hypothetical protein